MKTRILFGSIMLAGMIGLLWLDWHLEATRSDLAVGIPLAGLLAALAALGTLELAQLAQAAGLPTLPRAAAVLVVVLSTLPVWRQIAARLLPLASVDDLPLLVLGSIAAVVFFAQMAWHRTAEAIARLAATLLAVIYLGSLGACMMALRVRFGLPALAIFLAAVKFTDIGAYFTGTAIGRHKLIPWLSPGKSWEGLFGGLIAAAGITILLNGALPVLGMAQRPIMELWQAAVFGAAVGLVGQFGDLSESLLKRNAGLKDSGALVPSFGGVLDIIDSPLMAGPAAYVLLAVLS